LLLDLVALRGFRPSSHVTVAGKKSGALKRYGPGRAARIRSIARPPPPKRILATHPGTLILTDPFMGPKPAGPWMANKRAARKKFLEVTASRDKFDQTPAPITRWVGGGGAQLGSGGAGARPDRRDGAELRHPGGAPTRPKS